MFIVALMLCNYVLLIQVIRKTIKNAINLCNKIFKFFEDSHIRKNKLTQVQLALNNKTRKLIKPIATFWFSNHRSF